jgi:hypothetical protein
MCRYIRCGQRRCCSDSPARNEATLVANRGRRCRFRTRKPRDQEYLEYKHPSACTGLVPLPLMGYVIRDALGTAL